MQMRKQLHITRNNKRNTNLQRTLPHVNRHQYLSFLPKAFRKNGLPSSVDIYTLKTLLTGQGKSWGLPCNICNRETQMQYHIGSHSFCNFGCIQIYLDRIGGKESIMIFDLGYLMLKKWANMSWREVFRE